MTIGKRHALLWGPFFIFIVAFILHVNQMFVMFAALSLLAPVSYMLGRRKLADIEVARHGKSIMTAGERGTVTLTVENSGNLRQFFVSVRDRLPEGLESPENGEVVLADLLPGEYQRLAYSLVARRRGVYDVGPPQLEASDYLGLYQFTRREGDSAELLVYPRAIPVPDLWPRSLHGRTPRTTARRIVGPSTEYYGPRDYFPGDDIRQVDWKTTARRNKLTIRETEQSDAMECFILLDLSAKSHVGAGDRSTMEYAATLAASLSTEAIARGCSIGMIAHGAEDLSVLASSAPGQQIALLEALARAKADGRRGPHECFELHLEMLPPGCVVAVISPGTDPGLVGLAARLQGLEHPTSWFALAPHSFESFHQDRVDEYEGLVSRLAAQGCRVYRIRGDVPLETNLWGGDGSGRRA